KSENSKVVEKTKYNYVKADVKLAVAEAFGRVTLKGRKARYNIMNSTIRAKKQNKYRVKDPVSVNKKNELVE
ncbi:GSCOCG00009239001-RA-CDS, partial [Cotesia congregata]